MGSKLPEAVKRTIENYRREFESYTYQNKFYIGNEGYFYVIYKSAELPSGYILIKEDGTVPSSNDAKQIITLANGTLSGLQYVIKYGTERILNFSFINLVCKILKMTLNLVNTNKLDPETLDCYKAFQSVPIIFVQNHNLIKLSKRKRNICKIKGWTNCKSGNI